MSVKSPRRASNGLVAIAVALVATACGNQPGEVGGREGDAATLDIGVSTIPADFLVVSDSRVPSEVFDVEPTLYLHVG